MRKIYLSMSLTCAALLGGACVPQPQRGAEIVVPHPSAVNAVDAPAAVVPAAPIAAKKPYAVSSPNGGRIDNYYWLRDDTRQSGEMLNYLKAENAYRDAVMAPSRALQQKLYEELIGRIKPDDASVPVYEHGYWYYTRFIPGQDYPIYARRKGNLSAAEEIMLDGNALAVGHEYFQIGAAEVSRDGRLLAYTEDDIGRRQYTLKIKDLATGTLLQDSLTNVEPQFVWAADSKTLLYVEKDPVTLLSVRVHKHQLGAQQSQDVLVYEEADHSYYMDVGMSRSEKYLFIDLQSTQQTEVRYAEASDPQLRFKPVLAREANLEYHVDAFGDDFIIRTNWQAPNFRIMRTPVAGSGDKRNWRDVVAERPDVLVEDVVIDSGEPAYSMTLVHTPGIDSKNVRYVYSSLITPRTTYDYEMRTGIKELKKTEAVLGGYNPADFVTQYLHATARDGTQIPVSVAYAKHTALDGSAPLYQYAYGSYGISTDPVFRANWVSLLQRGFVVAIAHVRGGQELGRQWFENGRLLHKKNTFTDFIDVTEFLVKQGYGAKDRVFAEGGSAGGLLIGAVANMAPQAYRGIIAYVPFVDVVTTMLDESIPLTSNEFDQWGNPKQKIYYDYMLSYSPYDNVRAQDYPAMLVITGLWDSQVQYYEPAKWVAKLRATKTDRHPLVFSVNMAAGHGGMSGRFQRYHDTALEYAFIFRELGIEE